MKCDFEIGIKLKAPIPQRGGGFLYYVPQPCGKCFNCKKNKANQWSFRINQELKTANNGYFVTLTYRPEYVPLLDNGITTLRKKDAQNFIKRLRKHESETKDVNYGFLKAQQTGIKLDINKPLKYFAAGEYGEERFRPHLHFILMNVNNIENINKAWSIANYNKETKEYEYDPIGMVDIKPAHINNIDYCVKYLHKSNEKIYWKIRKGAEREFHLTSTGLGKEYVTPEIVKFHNATIENNYLMTERNYKIPMPRYYRKLIYDENKQKDNILKIKEIMEEKEQKERKELGDKYDRIVTLSKHARQNRLKNQIKKREYDG